MGAQMSVAVYKAWAFATALPIIGSVLKWFSALPTTTCAHSTTSYIRLTVRSIKEN